MTFTPILDMRSTTIRKAFIINALVLALIATVSIELRRYLDIRKETKRLTIIKKMWITLLGTFLIGIIIYISTRIIFGFGEGLLASYPYSKSIF
mgnify:CR=1 FL=1